MQNENEMSNIKHKHKQRNNFGKNKEIANEFEVLVDRI